MSEEGGVSSNLGAGKKFPKDGELGNANGKTSLFFKKNWQLFAKNCLILVK